jgi:hypothetical protein
MIEVTIDVPQGDIDAMRDALRRYAAWFHKGPEEAVKKACVYVVRSLRSSTRASKTERQIVPNPTQNMMTAAVNRYGRAHAHIQAYYAAGGGSGRKGKRKDWLPPLRSLTKENRAASKAIERYTQRKGVRYTPLVGTNPGISASDAKRIAREYYPKSLAVRRSGLAKRAWGLILGQLGQNAGNVSDVTKDMADVMTTQSDTVYSVLMHNKLGYVRKAMKADVNSVLARARRAMIDEMEGHAKRALRESGMRAA